MRDLLKFVVGLVVAILTVLIVVPFLLIFIISALAPTKATHTAKTENAKTVAVIQLQDEISDVTDVINALYEQADNDNVQGIVLRIDSPGGSVGPSQDIYYAVKALKGRKPIVASMGGVAASGGLYAALGASKIFAQPGTITGSIGVILEIPNFTDITQKVGVKMLTVKSGVLKDVGNPFREPNEVDLQFLQEFVSASYSDFVNAVVDGRGITREKVLTFADGRPILGSQAKELGLIDEIGDLHAASRAIYDILKTPLAEGEYPKLYYPDDEFAELKAFWKKINVALSTDRLSTRLKYELSW